MSSSPRPLLEYYDVCLYDEDMDNLQGLGWLSDNNLSFWYEYLEREVIPNFTDTSVLLIRPSLAFLIAQTPDPSMIADALPPNLMDASHLFLPINDNTDTTSVGGSHWSLLIVSLRDNVSMSYDSLHNANEEPARHMSSAFSKLFNSKRAGAGSGGAGAGQEFEFVSMQTPQQENGSDCGVSVCLLTRLLVGRLLDTNREASVDMSVREGDAGAAVDCRQGREEMISIIKKIVKEQGRKVGGAKDVEITTTTTNSSVDREVDGEGVGELGASMVPPENRRTSMSSPRSSVNVSRSPSRSRQRPSSAAPPSYPPISGQMGLSPTSSNLSNTSQPMIGGLGTSPAASVASVPSAYPGSGVAGRRGSVPSAVMGMGGPTAGRRGSLPVAADGGPGVPPQAYVRDSRVSYNEARGRVPVPVPVPGPGPGQVPGQQVPQGGIY